MPCNRPVAIALTGAIALLTTTAARADAPWSAPAEIGPRVARTDAPVLDFLRAGVPLLTWNARAAEPTAPVFPETDRVLLATRAADGTIDQAMLRDDAAAQAPCGARCVAVLRRRTVAARHHRRTVLRVSIGTGPGALGPARTIAAYDEAEQFDEQLIGTTGPVIAADRGGAVAVAWVEAQRTLAGGSPQGYRLRLVTRAPHGTFGHARTIAEAGRGLLRQPRLAFHGREAVTVAYVRESRTGNHTQRIVQARLVRLRGAARAAQALGPAPQSFTDLRVAAAPGGRTVVAWGNVHGTVMGFEDRWVVRAAIRPATASQFAPAQVLDRGAVKDAGAPGEVAAGIAADGSATVAWSSVARAVPVDGADVRVVTARPGRRFGPPQTLASGGVDKVEDLAVSQRGAGLLTWTHFGPGRSLSIMAAYRPPGAAAFGAPERVTNFAPSFFNALDPAPSAAIDDGTGQAAIAWAGDTTAGDPPLHVPLSAVLRLATRTEG
jgi:hypothetical protein